MESTSEVEGTYFQICKLAGTVDGYSIHVYAGSSLLPAFKLCLWSSLPTGICSVEWLEVLESECTLELSKCYRWELRNKYPSAHVLWCDNSEVYFTWTYSIRRELSPSEPTRAIHYLHTVVDFLLLTFSASYFPIVLSRITFQINCLPSNSVQRFSSGGPRPQEE
jgi:hypothetical protein